MSTPIVKLGSSGAIEQPIRLMYDRTRGFTTIRTWEGRYADLFPQCAVLRAAGYSYDLYAISPQRWRLVGTIAYDLSTGVNDPTNIVNDWEFLPATVEKAILQADIPLINALSESDKQRIKTSIDGNSTMPTGLTTDGETLWKLMKAGQTSTQINAPVIRHTVTVGNDYSVVVANTNAGNVLSRTALLAEGIPASVLFSIPNQTYGGTLSLIYGWKKSYPTVTLSASSKTKIVQEWHYGLWATVDNTFV